MPNGFDHVRFLLEQEQREVANFWTRTNVFLLIHTAALGAVVAGLSSNPSMRGEFVVAATGGVVASVVWLQAHRMSCFYSS